MELIKNPIGTIISELYFEMFCYLTIVEEIEFFYKKRTTVYNPNYFWSILVQDWSKTSPANAVCSVRTLSYSNVIQIDFFVSEKIKNRCCSFDNQRINLAKKRRSFNYRALSTEFDVKKPLLTLQKLC